MAPTRRQEETSRRGPSSSAFHPESIFSPQKQPWLAFGSLLRVDRLSAPARSDLTHSGATPLTPTARTHNPYNTLPPRMIISLWPHDAIVGKKAVAMLTRGRRHEELRVDRVGRVRKGVNGSRWHDHKIPPLGVDVALGGCESHGPWVD